MRLPRWAPWVEGVLSGSPAITSVKPFADAGITDPRFGHIITLSTGAQIELQWVRTSPPSGDDREEVPVTGEPPVPVTLPELPSSGRTSLSLIEQHLAALIVNGGIRRSERSSGSRPARTPGCDRAASSCACTAAPTSSAFSETWRPLVPRSARG